MITPEQLIAEVRDEIERLRGEPTSEDHCLAALRRYLAAPGPDRLGEPRSAYLAVPEHRRVFLLGDMDARDVPLRQLLTPVGYPLMGFEEFADAPTVTEADKQDALAWLAEWTRAAAPEEQARWRDPERPAIQRDVIRFASGVRVVGVSITGSAFWDSQGQNWIGRLLELVRAELASAGGPAVSAGNGQDLGT